MIIKKFKRMIFDDFNIPGGLVVLFECLKDDRIDPAVKKKTLMEMDRVLGLDIFDPGDTGLVNDLQLPEEVRMLLEKRRKFRESKQWHEADRIRDRIEEMGFSVVDTNEGQEVYRKK